MNLGGLVIVDAQFYSQSPVARTVKGRSPRASFWIRGMIGSTVP